MMEEKQDNKNNQEEQAALTVGATLREARERMGLSVADVVNRLKFAPRQVEALEQDDYAQLPEAAFVRGFVRSYARLLQLDEKPLLEALPDGDASKVFAAQRQDVEVPFPNVYALRRSNILWLSAALVVALALGVFAWLHGRESHPTAVSRPEPLPVAPLAASGVDAAKVAAEVAAVSAPTSAPSPEPVVAAAPEKPAEPAPRAKLRVSSTAAGVIHLTFGEDAWVEVKDKDGQILMSQINPAGTEQGLDGNPPFTLTIGHAGGVKLYYKGKQVDLAPSTNVDVAHVTLE